MRKPHIDILAEDYATLFIEKMTELPMGGAANKKLIGLFRQFADTEVVRQYLLNEGGAVIEKP